MPICAQVNDDRARGISLGRRLLRCSCRVYLDDDRRAIVTFRRRD